MSSYDATPETQQVQLASTPSVPDSGWMKEYFKSDGVKYSLDHSGVERVLTQPLLAAGAFPYSDGSKLVGASDIFMYDASTQRFGWGVATPLKSFHFQMTGSAAGVRFEKFGGDLSIWTYTAEGTPSAPTPTAAGRQLTGIQGWGWDGTVYGQGGGFISQAAGTWSSTNHGSYWSLRITPQNTTTQAEFARITAVGSGRFGFGSGITSPNATVQTKGISLAITTKTADYTATVDDHTILCNAGSAGFTIFLPAASTCTGLILNIKKIDTTGNMITITPSGSETIDGATTQTIAVAYMALTVQSNGASWYII